MQDHAMQSVVYQSEQNPYTPPEDRHACQDVLVLSRESINPQMATSHADLLQLVALHAKKVLHDPVLTSSGKSTAQRHHLA